MVMIKVGSNVFPADNDFTIVGMDDSNRPILCGLEKPSTTRLLWITFRQGGAFLNADLADTDGETALQIRENVITLNKENTYILIQIPENQIPPDCIIIVDRHADVTMALRRYGEIWDFNGDFYHRGWHVVATPNGTEINPPVPRV